MQIQLSLGSQSPTLAGVPSVNGSLLLGRDVNSPFTWRKLEARIKATTYNHLIWSRSRTEHKHL